MVIRRNTLLPARFNAEARLPYELRSEDVRAAVQDVYDFFFEVGGALQAKGLPRLDDMLRAPVLSGVLADMLAASLAKHSKTLVRNRNPNGLPDLVIAGAHADDAVAAADEGLVVRAARDAAALELRGARPQWLCLFLYTVEPPAANARARAPMSFTEICLARMGAEDFKRSNRGAVLGPEGLAKLRDAWVYRA